MEAALQENSWSQPSGFGLQSAPPSQSYRQFSRLVGCDHKTVMGLVAKGMPNPQQDAEAALAWYKEHGPKQVRPRTVIGADGLEHPMGYGAGSAKVRYTGWGMLTGWQAISDYLGVSIQTAYRWRRREALPVCNLPDGRVAISMSLIDQWLMSRYEAQLPSAQGRR